MSKLIKHHFKLYKRFELDIWGLLNSNPVFGHPIIKFFQDSYRYRAERAKRRFRQFIYRIDIVNPDRTHKRRKWRFVSMQLVRLFYKGVNQRKIYHFSRLASSSLGLWVENFLLLVESRVSVILYRVNWIPNILFLKQFLNHGNVIVDGRVSLSVNCIVKPFQLVTLLPIIKNKIQKNMIFRLYNNMLYFNAPRYIFSNFKIMFSLVFRNPKLGDLFYPILLDIYRLNDLN